MSSLRQLPDLGQLKKWGSLDASSFKEIRAALEKNQKILILAPKDSGKNTVQHAIVNYLHRMHKEPMVLPSIEGVSAKKFKSNLKLKSMKKHLRNFKSYVAAIQYTGSSKTDISDLTSYLLEDFDLIVDLRNISGSRVVCNLIKGRKNINLIYTNPKFEKYIAA
ncbi:hypothetical protein BMS_1159 [Halobacteriovorax marinus SJ]|uniref:Uncharacterized protein n=1 Tax=Halobacteriovorax marinus (strain ATCC BAA-682 / DSM 15412 / SJ) TaxID=862908 RepID=E1WYI9_HALMS|nr:hypothetical protein [Halobacteriovorax marinus]CBW26037.1 hypothetical protein BMS_1159 [Halobacteriovorax marinus SJ]